METSLDNSSKKMGHLTPAMKAILEGHNIIDNTKHNEVENPKTLEDPAEHKISIRFEDIPKPTELEPLIVDKSNTSPDDSLSKFNDLENVGKYSVPKALIDYVDQLVKDNPKLSWFRNYEICTAPSAKETAAIIYNERGITPEQKEKMLSLLGESVTEKVEPKIEVVENYVEPKLEQIKETSEINADDESTADPETAIVPEQAESISISQPDEAIQGKEEMEEIDAELDLIRAEYINLLIGYIGGLREKKAKYIGLIKDLNAPDRQMPIPAESAELKEVKKKYIGTLRKKAEFLRDSYGMEALIKFTEKENNILQTECSSVYTVLEKRTVESGQKCLDKYLQSGFYNKMTEALVSGDINAMISNQRRNESISPTYMGLRFSPRDFLSPNKLGSTETIKPIFVAGDGVLPVSKTSAEQIVEKKKIPALPDLKLADDEDKDNGINFPAIDFEGKKLEVIRQSKNGVEIVKVNFDGREIAEGIITESGPKIEIGSEYKNSWWQEKTQERRAFENVLPMIKVMRI